MSKPEDLDLSTCVTPKPAMPLFLENELTPLRNNKLTEDFNAFKDAISKTVTANIELLKELPPPRNFSLEEVVTYFEKKVKSDLEKDTLFEKSVEVSRYANSMYEAMDKYFKEIFDVHTATKKRNSISLFELSKFFLNSDLNDDFLKFYSDSFFVFDDYLDLYDSIVTKERRSLIFFKHNFKKFERVCISHNRWVEGFQSKLSLTSKNRVKLLWYIDMNNSKTVEELFKDKLIKTIVLDKTILDQLVGALEKSTTELESMIAKKTRTAYIPETDVDDSIKTFTTLMTLGGL